MMRRSALVAVVASLFPCVAAAQETTLEDVLAGYYEAVGGLEAWKSVKSLKATGTMSMRRGMEAPFIRLVKRPDKVRIEFTIQGMTGIRAYDGETAWMLMPFRGKSEPEVVEGNAVQGLMADADLDGPLMGYEESGHQLKLVGLEETEGTRAYKLEVTLKGGDVQYHYLDAEFFVPIKVEATRQFRGNTTEVETILSDYKEVGGLWIAHSVQTRSPAGRGGQSITLESVELNPPIDDAVFAMPEKDGE